MNVHPLPVLTVVFVKLYTLIHSFEANDGLASASLNYVEIWTGIAQG